MPSKWVTSKGSVITLVVSGRNNIFLVESQDTVLLVDAGMGYMYDNLLLKIKKTGAVPSVIALTHAHYDHVENTLKLKEHFGAGVLIHRAEAEHLKAGVNPEDKPVKGKFTIEGENYPPVIPDIIVDDVYEAGGGIVIMHTPGHTPGSVSVIVDDEIAAVGDAMFNVFPGQAMVPYVMDRRVLLKSWKKLLDTKCSFFLPSHGRATTRQTVEKVYKKYA